MSDVVHHITLTTQDRKSEVKRSGTNYIVEMYDTNNSKKEFRLVMSATFNSEDEAQHVAEQFAWGGAKPELLSE
jgi:hypothetical protein